MASKRPNTRPVPGIGAQLMTSFWVFVSLAGAVTGLTLLFLGMRDVMAIGGSCASGGPYVAARPCPSGTPEAMLGGIFGGGFFFLIYLYQTIRHGVPGFASLAWSALFLSLGFNFMQFGFDPPSGDGPVWGWLISGVLFIAMGGAPLILLGGLIASGVLPFFRPSPVSQAIQGVGAARDAISSFTTTVRTAPRSQPSPPSSASTPPTRAAPAPRRPAGTGTASGVERAGELPPELESFRAPGTEPLEWPPRERPHRTSSMGAASPPVDRATRLPEIRRLSYLLHQIGGVHLPVAPRTPPQTPPPSLAGSGIVAGLERLASLHEAGALSDDEFAEAKRRLLEGEL